MLKLFKKFRKDEDGAVTVDWVVLTAAVMALAELRAQGERVVLALAGAAYTAIETGASNLSSDTGSFIEGKDPN